MLRKVNLFIFLVNLISLTSFSQNPIKEYEQPKVIEGSNLSIYAAPNLELSNRDIKVFDSKLSYYMRFSSGYTKWRFTERLDYALSTTFTTSLSKNPYSSNDGFRSSVEFNFRGGASYFYLKDKLFAGLYSSGSTQFSRGNKPYYNINLYPNIGFGKITDAFIVNETSNFEKVLKDEKFINKPFDKKTRMLINLILDKRNGNVFSSLFKNDAEIEFFTELEKFMLDEKIINKPLNARVTMKLYQTLYDRNFILFPLYKGYQFQAELNYPNSNYEDTIIYPYTLSLNAVYGIPLSSKTSVLFSAHYVFPLNNNYNVDFYSANMHSPVFIRSEFAKISNYNYLNRGYIPIYGNLHYYKAAAEFYIFHYLNQMAGIIGSIKYITGKQKAPNSYMDYSVIANADLVLNIINKLRFTTGIDYYFNDKKEYYLSFRSGISYFIF